jgi:hypothetical protein
MPYMIKPVSGGFVVEDKKGNQFSNKPLTKKMAMKQRVAIALSESRKTGKPASVYFV